MSIYFLNGVKVSHTMRRRVEELYDMMARLATAEKYLSQSKFGLKVSFFVAIFN